VSVAEKERAQIIKYLRECQRRHEANLEAGKYKIASKHHADACKYASRAIEDGEHWIEDATQ
jgi:hypothetical protein